MVPNSFPTSLLLDPNFEFNFPLFFCGVRQKHAVPKRHWSCQKPVGKSHIWADEVAVCIAENSLEVGCLSSSQGIDVNVNGLV